MADGWVRKFYLSAAWLHKRNEILERDNHECQKCKSKGKFSVAECVHHIKHLKDRPDLALADGNLISLCGTCHNEEHPEKLHSNDKKPKYVNEERW
jgi:5-methylcytosine-specific restriction protein A